MDRRVIGSAGNDAVKGIHLAHQMTLAQSANRGIAGHCTDCITPKTDQSDAHTHARGSSSSLNPRMPAAYNEDVKITVRPFCHESRA